MNEAVRPAAVDEAEARLGRMTPIEYETIMTTQVALVA